MESNLSIKILAVLGLLLVWFPIIAPVLFALIRLNPDRPFMIDYLMPAELFPLVFIGSILLFITAAITHTKKKIIGWSILAMICFLIISQVIAVVTGLASGDIEPTGWQWMTVVVTMVFYIITAIITGISGLKLLSELFAPSVNKNTH